jgi:predicted O-methyltransferase YrrM
VSGSNLSRHQGTFLTLRETATERRFDMPYRKTYPFDGDYLSDRHRELAAKLHPSGMIDIGIEGWLLPADVLKLYEMAYCCGGDILELGAYRGLSAAVMNHACNDSSQSNVIVSIDLDTTAIELSRLELQGLSGGERVHFFQDDAGSAVRNLAGIKRQFRFAFVDHSHRYEHVVDACHQLHRVVEVDGFALFHDYNDPRNAVESETDYGVYQGVMDGLRTDRWEFWGIYGCAGLFRRIGPC